MKAKAANLVLKTKD